MTFNHTRIRALLIKIAHHRQMCLPIVDPHSHMNIGRSAYRFVKIEKVMIKKIAGLFFERDGEDFITEPENQTGVKTPGNYKEMHVMNAHLLNELKQELRGMDDTNLAALISYWVAALQVENDELENYVSQGE